MKILIVGNGKDQDQTRVRDYYQKYVDFFEKSLAGYEDAIIETCLLDDLIISVGDGDFSIFNAIAKCQLNEYNLIFFRGDSFRDYMDIISSIDNYAFVNGIKTINGYRNVRDSSKLLQAVQFHILNIPVAKTILVTQALINCKSIDNWSFPCIMKAVHGSHGNDNYVVSSLDDVRYRASQQSDKRFVLQRFIPNNGDYRLLMAGDKVLAIKRLATSGSHLNNTSQGGEASLVDLSQIPSRVIEDSKKIMKSLDMTIAGVDVLADKNTDEFFFLEVNAQPQLMTGAFIDKKEAIIRDLIVSLTDKR